MKRKRPSPRGSEGGSSVVFGALVAAALTALCTVAAVLLVAPRARGGVAVCGLVAAVAVGLACAEIRRRGNEIVQLRRRQAATERELVRRLEMQEAETSRLAVEVLPAAISRLHRGDSIEEALSGPGQSPALGAAFIKAHDDVVRSVLEAVKAEEDLRDSSQRAFVNVARRVQAIVHQQFQDLREMEERHGGSPDVFDDLLRLDHGTALIGRLADSLAVLGGSRPGRQWQHPVPLFNVLRGAMSRITDYQRVELHSVVEVAISGPTVEPLIHALAELLDNATRYSPPQTRVHMTAVEVQSGIAVEIEDGGVGLGEEARLRAERVLGEVRSGLDLADLGENPRLGLSVVGRLAQTHRFKVSLRPSAYGGVRAVLIIPRDLATAVPLSAANPSAAVRANPNKPVPAIALQPEEPRHIEINNNGLPQRRRGVAAPLAGSGSQRSLTAPQSATPTPPVSSNGSAPAAPSPPPGLWLAAFQNAVSGEGTSTEHALTDDASSKEGE
ncbi:MULTISPECIES: ATP-binding protein [Pseudofrankia]|uniref:ATP-binding protein n=1 Tax=Pseudofrankia TaxID=2994363 RepID=UPI000234C9FB|nr:MULTISPECIES: ATP-binding protein [Pseudofrankia]OHV34106.1 ATP-binding protein [Pseudofrankia sp. EUN1h]